MESAVVKNGVLYCPYCNAELTWSSYADNDFWRCTEDECYGSEEEILWDEDGNLFEETG